MLRRAHIWLGIGTVAAVLGFTELVPPAAEFARFVFYGCTFFYLLSLLFCLFEEREEGQEERTAGTRLTVANSQQRASPSALE